MFRGIVTCGERGFTCPLHGILSKTALAFQYFAAAVLGKYLLIDHSLTRAIDKDALAELVVEGPEQAELYRQMSR